MASPVHPKRRCIGHRLTDEPETGANHTEPQQTRIPAMDTHVHAPRRTPTPAEGPLDLHAAAEELLAQAEQQSSGRAARTMTPGAGSPLKQTLLALSAGQQLQEHVAPGPTTLLGIRGTCVLTDDDAAVTLTDGVWAACPTGPHTLEAISDTVVLITVTPTDEASTS